MIHDQLILVLNNWHTIRDIKSGTPRIPNGTPVGTPEIPKKLGKLTFCWKVQLMHIMQLGTVVYGLNQKIQPIFISWISKKVTWLGSEPMALKSVRIDSLLIFTIDVDDL